MAGPIDHVAKNKAAFSNVEQTIRPANTNYINRGLYTDAEDSPGYYGNENISPNTTRAHRSKVGPNGELLNDTTRQSFSPNRNRNSTLLSNENTMTNPMTKKKNTIKPATRDM